MTQNLRNEGVVSTVLVQSQNKTISVTISHRSKIVYLFTDLQVVKITSIDIGFWSLLQHCQFT